MCGETRCARFAACAARRMAVQALWRDRADPRELRKRAVEPEPRAASTGRARTRYASRASIAKDPTGTILSLRPLPKRRTTGTCPSRSRSSALRATASDTRAPVAYRSSNSAASRSPMGVSSAWAASSKRPTSSTDRALGRWLPWRGARSCAVTSTLRTPSASAYLCSPLIAAQARATDDGAASLPDTWPDASPARCSSTS